MGPQSGFEVLFNISQQNSELLGEMQHCMIKTSSYLPQQTIVLHQNAASTKTIYYRFCN